MAAISNFLKENAKFAYGGLGLPFAAMDIKGIIDSDNKFKAILKTMKDLVLIRVSMVGTFMAIGAAVKALVKDTGSLDAALKRLSQVQHFQRMFAPFVGGARAARKEVADLVQFAARTPFKFEGVAQAALTLQTLSKGQFAGEPALKKLGDAAAASGNSIEDSAKAVGEFYQALNNGQPINSSVEAMRQMGLISTVAATNLERLADSGGNTITMAGELTAALSASRGGMASFANDLESVTAAREKAVEQAKVSFGSAFTERDIQTTKNYTEAIVAITPALSKAGNVLSTFVGGVETATSSFVKWIAKSGMGAAAIQLVTVALVALTVAFTAVGVMAIPAFIGFIGTLMVALEGAVAAMVAANAALSGLGTAILVVGNIIAGTAIAASLLAAGVAVIALGFAIQSAINHTKEFNRALAEEMQAHEQAIRAINAHVAAIQTLADKYQAVSEATQQQIKDQTELNNLLAKKAKIRGEIETGDPALRMAKEQELAEVERKIEQQRKKIDIDRKTRQRAERTPAIAGPEREALIQLQTRRQLMLEEQRLEERMALQPGRAPGLLRERAGTLAQRAAIGRTGLEDRERIALRQSELRVGRGDVEAAIAGQKQQLAELQKQSGTKEQRVKLKQQIATNEAVLDKMDADIAKAALQGGANSSVVLEAQAQQLQQAINAKAARERGDVKAAQRAEALAGGVVAGPEAPAQLMELQKRAGFAKQLEAQAPELEAEARRKNLQAQEHERAQFVTELQTHIERGIAAAARQGPSGQKELLTDLRSFIGHFEELRKIFPDPKAAQLAMEKVGTELLNIPAETFKPIADSLTRVGGGGGVGGPTGDPRTIALQRMNTLQGAANTYLEQIEMNTRAGTQAEPTEFASGVPSAVPGETPGGIPGTNPNVSQAAVNQIEANRKAYEAQFAGTAGMEVGPTLDLESSRAYNASRVEMFKEQMRQTKLAGGFGAPAQAAAQTMEAITNLGTNVVPGIPVGPMPQPVTPQEETPQSQTYSLLNKIYFENKQSNDHLSVVSDNSKDQGRSF